MKRIFLAFLVVFMPSIVASENVNFRSISVEPFTDVEQDGRRSLHVRVCANGVSVDKRPIYGSQCARLKADTKPGRNWQHHIIFESAKFSVFPIRTSNKQGSNYKFWLRENSSDDTQNFRSFIKKAPLDGQLIIGAICKKLKDKTFFYKVVVEGVEKRNATGLLDERVMKNLSQERSARAIQRIAERCVKTTERIAGSIQVTVGNMTASSLNKAATKSDNEKICGFDNKIGRLSSLRYKIMQQGLKELGHYSGSIDGDFGPKSCAALKQFMRSQSSGVLDFERYNVLVAARLNGTQKSVASNSIGTEKKYENAVACLQNKAIIRSNQSTLKDLGLYNSTVDGVPGEKYNQAVIEGEKLLQGRFDDEKGCLSVKERQILVVIHEAQQKGSTCSSIYTPQQINDTFDFLKKSQLTKRRNINADSVGGLIWTIETVAGLESQLLEDQFYSTEVVSAPDCILDKAERSVLNPQVERTEVASSANTNSIDASNNDTNSTAAVLNAELQELKREQTTLLNNSVILNAKILQLNQEKSELAVELKKALTKLKQKEASAALELASTAQEELENLKKELETSRVTNEQLSLEVSQLTERNKKLEGTVELNSGNIAQITERLRLSEALRAQLESENEELVLAQNEKQNISAENASLNMQIDELRETLQTETNELKTKLELAESSLSTLQQEAMNSENDVREALLVAAEQKQIATEYKQQLEMALQDKQELTLGLKELEADIEKADAIIAENKEKYALMDEGKLSLIAKVLSSELDAEVMVQEALESQAAELTDVKNKLKAAQTKMNKLSVNTNVYAEQLKLSQQSMKKLEIKYATALKQIQEITSQKNVSSSNGSNFLSKQEDTVNQNSVENLPIDETLVQTLIDDVKACIRYDVSNLSEGAYIDVVMRFNQQGLLRRGDFELLESGIANGLKANMVFQAIKRAAFVCEGEGYNLPVEQYDRWKSLKVRFEFNG